MEVILFLYILQILNSYSDNRLEKKASVRSTIPKYHELICSTFTKRMNICSGATVYKHFSPPCNRNRTRIKLQFYKHTAFCQNFEKIKLLAEEKVWLYMGWIQVNCRLIDKRLFLSFAIVIFYIILLIARITEPKHSRRKIKTQFCINLKLFHMTVEFCMVQATLISISFEYFIYSGSFFNYIFHQKRQVRAELSS